MDAGKTEFLSQHRIAVVGISKSNGFGNTIFSELRRKGYDVFPVSRTAEQVEGATCYKRLDDVPMGLDGVITVVPPAATEAVVDDCIRLGIPRVWMQQGSYSSAAAKRAEDNGLRVVPGGCVLMYAQPNSMHKVHGWVWKLIGKY